MSVAVQPAPARNGHRPPGPVLRIAGLSKTFGATRALIDASLDIRPGEIHALVGQNGSGKSTLIKTLAGYHTPDPGSAAEIDGAQFDLGHAVPENLRFVHQDLGLVLELNAMDNLALHGGFSRGSLGRVRWSEQEQETYRVLARFGVDLDIHRPLAAATPVAARPDAPVVLEARDVHGRWLRGVDLDVHRGEILGIAGLAGAGVLELPYVIAGCARHPVTGRIRLPERSEEWSDAADARRLDIPLVPADRGREGIVAEFAVSENLSLSVLGRLGRRGKLAKRDEAELVDRWSERLGIVTAGPNAPI